MRSITWLCFQSIKALEIFDSQTVMMSSSLLSATTWACLLILRSVAWTVSKEEKLSLTKSSGLFLVWNKLQNSSVFISSEWLRWSVAHTDWLDGVLDACIVIWSSMDEYACCDQYDLKMKYFVLNSVLELEVHQEVVLAQNHPHDWALFHKPLVFKCIKYIHPYYIG